MCNHNSNHQEYLKDIIIHTLTSVDLSSALRNISEELGKLFNADRVHFRFFEENSSSFTEVIEEYRKNESIPSAKNKMVYPEEFDIYLKEQLLLKEHLLIIHDINDPKYPKSFNDLFKSLDVKNEIILPIFYRDQLESVFFITNTESPEMLSEQNLEFLMPIARQISIGTHMFKLNENLTKVSNSEKMLREIIIEVRKYERPNDIFEYVARSLAKLYVVNRVLYIHQDSLGNYVVAYEAINEGDKNLEGKSIFKIKSFNELTNSYKDPLLVINDINQIQNLELKQYFEENDIRAFMHYPLGEFIQLTGGRIFGEKIMVCSNTPRKWSYQDIESLKLITLTVAIIYVDIRNRKEIKEIEETFIASLVHDLKSPLYSEQKALEFLMSRKPDTLIESFTEYFKEMYNTNDELLRLITNLLTIYSLELGQHELKKDKVNINKIIDDSIRTIKHLADDSNTKIIKKIQKNLEDVYMDPDEIRRVFTNIISNAIRHNPKGIEVTISAKIQEESILISVSDDGVGISESEKNTIFQKFKSKKGTIGSGLGLYLSKQIIAHHEGQIWVESKEGIGTTFYFTLPICKDKDEYTNEHE